jgi:hypothetical protein
LFCLLVLLNQLETPLALKGSPSILSTLLFVLWREARLFHSGIAAVFVMVAKNGLQLVNMHRNGGREERKARNFCTKQYRNASMNKEEE